MLRFLLVFGLFFAFSRSFFIPSLGGGSSVSTEEVNQKLQTSLLKLERYFQSPAPEARFTVTHYFFPSVFISSPFSFSYFTECYNATRCHLRTVGQSKAYFDRRRRIAIQRNKEKGSFRSNTNKHSSSSSITDICLINTPCFSHDSVGNSLSNYLEARLCADVSGLHFLAPHKMFINGNNERFRHMNGKNESTIFTYLPALVQHQHPATSSGSVELEDTCPCADACHERKKALLHSRVDAIRKILDPALMAHRAVMERRNISILQNAAAFALPLPNDNSIYEGTYRKRGVMSSQYVGSSAPIIPDVSIHYRCGDNTVGNYGFLPFQVYSDLLDKSARSIYIMAENPFRKTQTRKNRKMDDKCAIILRALVKYISKRFRHATVVLLRGANIYNDLVRLSYAKQTFCSVSTFCFYPALLQRNKVYFPVTKLIADGHMFEYHDQFKWLTNSNYSVVFGARIRASYGVYSIMKHLVSNVTAEM